ncbi:MAG: hypothetical protein L6R39_007184 [Caloplaca ligustica]|nr:MAG: hypothetical protein L6R39_007184 [Caloplaca ligustica]
MVPCSGDMFPSIVQKQFNDGPPTAKRPIWGNRPDFITLSMGGNDISFKQLVTECVYSLPVFTLSNCDQVIADSQARVNSPQFVTDALQVIIAALSKGTSRVGPSFRVYVVGYAQFFNEQTTQCNDISFKPSWSPFARQYLTIERRQALNEIARNLNGALRAAVTRASIGAPNRVFFVDYDDQFDGHRFCDRHEPNPNDPDTWFYTLGADEAAVGDFLNSIPRIRGLLNGQSDKTLTDGEFFQLITEAAAGDELKASYGILVFRVFHPNPVGHRAIAARLRSVILATRALPSAIASVNKTETS